MPCIVSRLTHSEKGWVTILNCRKDIPRLRFLEPLETDTLDGDQNGSTLAGLGGNDTLNGSNGVDSLFGGTGDDSLTGEITTTICMAAMTGWRATADPTAYLVGSAQTALMGAKAKI